MAINIKWAKVCKLHEDLVRSDRDLICIRQHDNTTMASNNRYIKGSIKTIHGHVDIKWGIGQKLDNNSSTKPIKKLNRRIKLFN